VTQLTRAKLRRAFLGRPIPPEQRALISATLTGKVQSPETVAKRSETINQNRVVAGLEPRHSGEASKEYERAQAKEYKQRVRVAEGKPEKLSPEWKVKIAASLKARFESLPPEEQARIKANGAKGGGYWTGKKRGPLSEEARAKLSAIHKARLASLTPEQREARMAAARAKNWRSAKVWTTPTFEVLPAS